MSYLIFFLCCRHNLSHVVSAALRAVGNIVTGDDVQTQVELGSLFFFLNPVLGIMVLVFYLFILVSAI